MHKRSWHGAVGRAGERGAWQQAAPRRRPVFALRDLFTTGDAAPLASPRGCEPGPGSLVAVQDAGSWSIADGRLQFVPPATPGGMTLRAASAVARADALPIVTDVQLSEGLAWFGYWGDSAMAGPPASGLGVFVDAQYTWIYHPNSAVLCPADPGTRIRLMVQPKPAGGAFYYVQLAGLTSGWLLMGHDASDDSLSLYGGWSNSSARGACRQLAIVDDSFFPELLLADPTPPSATTRITHRDALHEARITQGSPLVNGDRAELRVRYLNEENHFALYTEVVGGAVRLGIDEVWEGNRTARVGGMLPIGAGEAITVQLTTIDGVLAATWRTSQNTAVFESAGGVSLEEPRPCDQAAGVRLATVGQPTIDQLTSYRVKNQEIPREV